MDSRTPAETSFVGPARKRERWLEESVAAVGRLLDDGIPIIGYTWFPAFSLVTWAYRRGRRPTEAYLAHMGLWDLRDDGTGRFRFEATPLVDQFRRLIEAGVPDDDRDVSSAA